MSSHLEVWKPSGRELFPLAGERVTLGKASTNAVALEHDPTVSRLHAILENHGSAWSIRDMGSRNGTYVNNEKVRAHALVNGDAIVVGDCQLRFLYSRALPPVDALRLMTQPGELMGVDAHVARSLNRRLPERRVFAR